MNDRIIFEAMLKKAGIIYIKNQIIPHKIVYEITAQDGPNNLGYRGFATYWEFINDELSNVGVWE